MMLSLLARKARRDSILWQEAIETLPCCDMDRLHSLDIICRLQDHVGYAKGHVHV